MTTRNPDANGWVTSAQAWLDRMPETGDFARKYVLDKPMIERAISDNPKTIVDIGCGDGRFCRFLKRHGITTTGIDPVEKFLEFAAQKDPDGNYLTGFAEALPFENESFDLAVFYLTLIDIDDMPKAIQEAVRILKPGGKILIANLNSFFTSNGTIGWIVSQDEEVYRPLGDYFSQRKDWFEWDGMRVRNWHRPLNAYMDVLLKCGMTLTYFDEPQPVGCPDERAERYCAAPYLMIMEWRKL